MFSWTGVAQQLEQQYLACLNQNEPELASI